MLGEVVVGRLGVICLYDVYRLAVGDDWLFCEIRTAVRDGVQD
jgi:hypothetical protein